MTQALSLNGSGFAKKTTGIGGLTTGSGFDKTICAWIKLNAQPASGYWFPILGVGQTNGSNDFLAAYVSFAVNDYRWLVWYGGAYKDLSQNLTVGQWYWVCFEYTASTKVVEVFVDNVSIGSMSAFASDYSITPSKIYVGQRLDENSATYANCIIQDARYFEEKIGSTKRATIYDSGTGTFNTVGTEKLQYKFDGDYVDAINSNTLTASGSGNSFVTGIVSDGGVVTYDSNFFGAGI
jgi:hypothetical protein